MTTAIRPKARDWIAQTWQSQANLSFFLVLLVISIFVLPAMGRRRVNIKLASDIVGSLMLIAGVAIAWGRQGLPTIGIAVAIPTLIFRWTAWAALGRFSRVWNDDWTIAEILVIGHIPMAQVFRAGPINTVRIQGAVAPHTFCWELPMHTVIKSRNTLMPLQLSEGPMTSVLDWIYYSFCTLSTLGYDDIIPTGRTSRRLAIGEAISVQLFLAIFIARLSR